MWTYILTHWRGQQSLARSVFLNGLLAYVAWTVLAGLGLLLGTSPGVELFVFVFLGAMLVWLAWALVGIVRCSVRVLFDPQANVLRKLGAGVAIACSLGFAAFAGNDVIHLFTAKTGHPVPGASRFGQLH